jgi:hypothetical protein
MASYTEAIESRRTPDSGRFKSLVVLYRASADYTISLAQIRLARIGPLGWIVSPSILASYALLNSTAQKKFAR